MLALGSLLGALASARRSAAPRQRVLIGAGIAFGALEVLVGLAPTYWLMAALLVPTGVAVLTFSTAANAIVQLGSAPEMRGRVMALYILVFLGGTPVGAPLIGALAEALGPRSSLLIGGLVSALGCVLAGLYLQRAAARVPVRASARPAAGGAVVAGTTAGH
jgi:MFS family permease